MKLLSLDPGGTTGWAFTEVKDDKIPKLLQFGECKDSTILELRDYFEECDLIVCEDFYVDPKKAQSGAFNNSTMPTIQVIGAIKSLAAQCGKKVVMQQNNLKPMGYGFAGLKYVKGKQGMHVQDAIAHGMYYLVKQKLSKPVGV